MLEEALYSLMERPRYDFRKRIKHIFRTPRRGREDHAGKDFIVTLDDQTEIPLQVKSSQWGRRKHNKLCRDGIVIPCIVVDRRDQLEAVVRKVVSCIKQTLEQIRLGFLRQMRLGIDSVLKDSGRQTAAPEKADRQRWCHRFEVHRYTARSQFACAGAR